MTIPGMEHGTVRLPHKPSAPLSFGFFRGHGPLSMKYFVVFLNGLIVPQSGWEATIESLQKIWVTGQESSSCRNHPSLLTYDRFGQGDSARDPADTEDEGHDMREVVCDLHALVHEMWQQKQIHISVPAQVEGGNGNPPQQQQPHLVFVANSIGCPIGRLYAETYPRTVAALLFLDSNMANSDLFSVFPDPDAHEFDPDSLPADVSVDELRDTRNKYRAMFDPSVRNPENLDRRNVAELLPYSDRPVLTGPDDRGPWLVVAEHDWDTFADEGLRGSLHTPKSLTNTYMNPAWRRYNEGLVKLAGDRRGEGPVTARGCGHFIQRDDPVFVAEMVGRIVAKLI